MAYGVLFFFKQKTAYEMRISDWSSDLIQRRLPTRHCIKAGVIIAQCALGISQCGQYGLLIAQRRLPLNGLTGAYLRAHAAAVEQSPRNEWQDREAGAGPVEPFACAERLEPAAGPDGQLGKPFRRRQADVGGAGGQLAFSSQNIGAAAQYVGPFPHWQRRQSQRRRGGIEQLEFPFRRCAEQDTKAEHRSALPRLYRSEEHTSELQSLMRISYAVFCLKKKTTQPMYTILYYRQKQNIKQ